MKTTSTEKKFFIKLLENQKESLANEPIKANVMQLISEKEFPTKKDENWRHTDIKHLLQNTYKLAPNFDIDAKNVKEYLIPDLESDILVFVNGNFSAQLSIISENSGINIMPLKEAKQKFEKQFTAYFETSAISAENLLTALNTAFSSEGAFVYIESEVVAKRTIQIVYLSCPQSENIFIQNRNLFVLEKNSCAEIFQIFASIGNNQIFSNTANEIVLNKNAALDLTIVQRENATASNFNFYKVQQAEGSTFNANTFLLNGNIIRNEITVLLEGKNCSTNLNGLSLAKGEQVFDNFVTVKHLQPECMSRTNYRSIANDKANAIFLGKIYVAPKAVKTDAQQSNKNVLLSKTARINSKPQLEIYADDVVCSHGSTIGQLDSEAIFYMQARGIGKEQAKALLLKAFVDDLIKKCKNEAFIAHLEQLINEYFEK